MIVLMFAVAVAFGALIGVLIAATYIQQLSPTAVERRNYLDAIAICRDLQKTPDALDLRDRAATTCRAFDAANRKDN